MDDSGVGENDGSRRDIATFVGVGAIELDALERAIDATDPDAVLMPARLLRRAIERDRGLLFLGRHRGRQTTYPIRGETLGAVVRPSELGRTRAGDAWPEHVVLLERPEFDLLHETPDALLLSQAWRRLFRARVQQSMGRKLAAGTIDGVGLEERIGRIGRAEFAEAWDVFHQDGWLLAPETTVDVYALFVAHFLELRHFAPELIHVTFPAIRDLNLVASICAADVDVEQWLSATRPEGAPEPGEPESVGECVGDQTVELGESEESASCDEAPGTRDRHLARRAVKARDRGNAARSAVLWTAVAERAAEHGTVARADRAEARAASRELVARLRAAVGFPERDDGAWVEALSPLLPLAARGFFPAEARLLHDLQRVCLDHERTAYRLDLPGWLMSLGRRPLETPLPEYRQVAITRHLRRALGRSRRLRLSRDQRAMLESVLRPACRRAETAMREAYRPRIARVLQETWVRPANPLESVAETRMVEELLDRVVSRGHLTLGDLRDAASRSDLKLPDMAGAAEFLQGGRLLEADRALSRELEGVHHRGEVYLRGLQRCSMAAFGTWVGRVLTRFVVLPFGGAYVALEGLQHLAGIPLHWLTGVEVHLTHPAAVGIVGLVTLGLLESPAFRAGMGRFLGAFGRLTRAVAYDLPARVLRAPFWGRILLSAPVRWSWSFVGKPLGVAGIAWAATRMLHGSNALAEIVTVGAFVLANLGFNTSLGRALEEALVEWLIRGWREFVNDVVPGLFRLVITTFEQVLETMERVLYAVDEWMRFRQGESRVALGAKAVFGPIWGVLAYLARMYTVVLIEPQINPIKHFPVVTVSHKVMLPFTLQITRMIEAPLTPLVGRVMAETLAWGNVLLLPGMFGFLVWELKSNWRLYRANRPATLQPEVVGGHGETVRRLLRPGFHSGTLPKAFARLRRATRRALLDPSRRRPERSALGQREVIHHVEEDLRKFIIRDTLALLARSPEFAANPIPLGAIELATNRIRVELNAPGGESEQPSVVLEVVERDQNLVATIARVGWSAHLSPERQRVLDDALSGLLKKCGVTLIERPRGIGAGGFPETRTIADVAISWTEWVKTWDRPEPSRTPFLSGEGLGAWPSDRRAR